MPLLLRQGSVQCTLPGSLDMSHWPSTCNGMFLIWVLYFSNHCCNLITATRVCTQLQLHVFLQFHIDHTPVQFRTQHFGPLDSL